MSEYESWISDFPQRCGDLLELCAEVTQSRNREVTFLLAVASACIAIPLDRMRYQERDGQEMPHPMKDRGLSNKRRKKFDELVGKKMRELDFWNDKDYASFGHGKLESVERNPDSWKELQDPKPFGHDKEFKTLLSLIRNALAHGSVFTRGNEIREIVLLSREYAKSDRYEFLILTPRDLKRVVQFWIRELARLHVTQNDIDASAAMNDENARYACPAA